MMKIDDIIESACVLATQAPQSPACVLAARHEVRILLIGRIFSTGERGDQERVQISWEKSTDTARHLTLVIKSTLSVTLIAPRQSRRLNVCEHFKQ